MSTESRWTPQQIRGGTNTETASSSEDTASSEGAWTEDLDVAIYGEQDWLLPGYGKQPESCGNWYPKEFCEKCGEPHLGESRCQNRACPQCWGTWSADRTVSAVSRLAGKRYAAEEPGDKRTGHYVLSPPEESVQSKREFYEAFKRAYKLAEEHGVRGGLVIPHGYRLTDETKQEFRAQDEYNKAWRYVRENKWDWRDQVYWSPHFHIIGLGRYEDVTAGDSDEDDGWVFKMVDSLERFESLTDRSGYDDMASRVRYLLSHATFEKDAGKAVVRWYGELAPGAFSPEEELSKGAWETIQRKSEEFVGGTLGEEESGDEESETCRRDGCDGELRTIFDAGAFLQQRRDELEREREHRLAVAFEWAIGELEPPPGMKHPSTEAEAEESFEALL